MVVVLQGLLEMIALNSMSGMSGESRTYYEQGRNCCSRAHDDEVLGCGGTIARHIFQGDVVHVVFMADGVASRAQNNPVSYNVGTKRAMKLYAFSGCRFGMR